MRLANSVPEYCPSMSEVSRRIEAKRKNEDWLREHASLLRERYADKYVAVSDEEVKASGKSLDGLFRQLKRKFKQDVFSTFAVDLITKEDVIWMFQSSAISQSFH